MRTASVLIVFNFPTIGYSEAGLFGQLALNRHSTQNPSF